MIKKLLIITGLVFLSLFTLKFVQDRSQVSEEVENLVLSPTPNSNGKQATERVTAEFEIYTNGTRRVFTDAMYHHQSEDVYIDSSNTNVVIVNHYAEKQPTWGDFFESLPMTLTKNCLITGTGQEFCNNETHELKFFLDGEVTPNVLDTLINRDTLLRVEYSRR